MADVPAPKLANGLAAAPVAPAAAVVGAAPNTNGAAAAAGAPDDFASVAAAGAKDPNANGVAVAPPVGAPKLNPDMFDAEDAIERNATAVVRNSIDRAIDELVNY